MPNWTTNYVEIRGTVEQIADLTAKTLTSDQQFDFNAIVPMPDELRDSQSPMTIVETQAEADAGNAKRPDGTSHITQAEADRRIEVYGFIDWYSWSIRHWGTKWNTHDVSVLYHSDTVLALQFDTAWSAPTPIFHALEAQGYTVVAHSEYEGGEEPDDFGDEPYSVFDRRVEVDYIKPEDRWGYQAEAA